MRGRVGLGIPLTADGSGGFQGAYDFFKYSTPSTPFRFEIHTAVVPHQVKMTSVDPATLPQRKDIGHTPARVPFEVIEVTPVHARKGMDQQRSRPVSTQVVPREWLAGSGTEPWSFRIAHAVIVFNTRLKQTAVALGKGQSDKMLTTDR